MNTVIKGSVCPCTKRNADFSAVVRIVVIYFISIPFCIFNGGKYIKTSKKTIQKKTLQKEVKYKVYI